MTFISKRTLATFTLFSMGLSCSLFDSGTVWKDGQYSLSWIDDPQEVTLSYHRSSSSSEPLIDGRVFSIGANTKYLVAKQHPGGDKTKTHFYYVIRVNNSELRPRQNTVVGPLSSSEFNKKSSELGLPTFSKTLKALE